MELLRGVALAKYLLNSYSKNPRGWNFTIAPSARESFFDALVSNPDEAWQLKIDSIFKPSPLVLGAKVEVDGPRVGSAGSIPYGYRKLDADLLLKLFNQANEPKETNLESILRPLDTVVPDKGGAYAQGPFVFTNKKIAAISQSQKQLDEKLSSEMKKLLRDSFPLYG